MDYQKIYDDFVNKFNRSETTPSEAGEVLVKIAGMFPNYNNAMIKAERAYALIFRDEILKTEEQSGKQVSVAKAETFANASIEATAFKQARGHVTNIEILIGSLKFLQKSLEVEYLNSNLN
jgi:hypothetical protein